MPPGVADRAVITSGPISTAPEQYELSWKVNSYSPIQEYKVAYRPVRVSTDEIHFFSCFFFVSVWVNFSSNLLFD